MHVRRRPAGSGTLPRAAVPAPVPRTTSPLAFVAAAPLLAAFLLAPLILPATVPPGAAPAFAQTTGRQLLSAEALEAETRDLVNRHRRDAGLPPLRSDPAIAAIARRHSEAMAAGRVPFGHEAVEGRRRRIERTIPLEAMAENVGANDRPARSAARAAVSGWLGSAGHRENIEGDYDTTGVGVARDRRGAWYFTQIFVKRAGARPRRPAR